MTTRVASPAFSVTRRPADHPPGRVPLSYVTERRNAVILEQLRAMRQSMPDLPEVRRAA